LFFYSNSFPSDAFRNKFNQTLATKRFETFILTPLHAPIPFADDVELFGFELDQMDEEELANFDRIDHII